MINMKEEREKERKRKLVRLRVREKELCFQGYRRNEIGRKQRLKRKREQCAVEENMRALRVFCSSRATSLAYIKDFLRVSRVSIKCIDILLYPFDFSKFLNFRPFSRNFDRKKYSGTVI